jgi:hypothetical protein
LLELVVDWQFFFFTAFFSEPNHPAFSARKIIGYGESDHRTDSRESISEGGQKGAVAQANRRRRVDRGEKSGDFTFVECRCLAIKPAEALGLDFPGWIHRENSFFSEAAEQHPDGGHVLFLGRSRAWVVLDDRYYPIVVRAALMLHSRPMSKSSELTVFRASGAITVPSILANAGPTAVKRFAEFFTVPIRNPR